MGLLMGIDIGTSSLKVMVVDETGDIKALRARDYNFLSPVNGYAEHDPEDWWAACIACLKDIFQIDGVDSASISAISFSGQMHGTVTLGADKKPLRPAILHCDARTGKELSVARELLGDERIRDILMNPLYTGFMLPSLLWIRSNEPEIYNKIAYVMLPKDYIRFKLTGEIGTDYSDASATLLFDVSKVCWSDEIISIAGFDRAWFPDCLDATAEGGRVSAAAASETGLKAGTIVGAGGADQVMQNMGNGIIAEGTASSNIGTSGQIAFICESPLKNPALNTNMFCSYRKGVWFSMAAMMNAGLCYNWFSHLFETVDYDEMNKKIAKIKPGSGGLIFLPYLNGERTPHFNPNLSGMFIGLTVNTDRAAMSRAVMEGVTYALNQCFELCKSLGFKADSMIASGGATKSREWMQIQADVYNLPIRVADTKEQACLGAAISAGVAAGIYSNVAEGCERTVRYKKEVFEPIAANHSIYNTYYDMFKEVFHESSGILERITLEGRK